VLDTVLGDVNLVKVYIAFSITHFLFSPRKTSARATSQAFQTPLLQQKQG